MHAAPAPGVEADDGDLNGVASARCHASRGRGAVQAAEVVARLRRSVPRRLAAATISAIAIPRRPVGHVDDQLDDAGDALA